MKRIRLSSEEKTVLRMLANGFGCPDIYPRHVFVSAVGSLERKGLAQGAWTEEHDLDDARITWQGKVYLAHNPTLRNPVDWKWIVTTASRCSCRRCRRSGIVRFMLIVEQVKTSDLWKRYRK